VRKHFPAVHCIDIARPSKVNALNEAEKKATELGVTFPIFYVDADTTLDENANCRISESLQKSPILLAAPTPVIDTSESSWIVRQYYKVWTDLHYVRQGVIATCSYVLTEEGRARFKRFPEVINDDGYVRCQFKSSEISNIEGAKIHIRAPKDVRSLIKIETRARLGNMELSARGLCTEAEGKRYSSAVGAKLFSKDFVPTLAYGSLALIIRIRAYLQYRDVNQYEWEKDLSSR
jgi:hypothetical protein